jgi:hypothetical protein
LDLQVGKKNGSSNVMYWEVDLITYRFFKKKMEVMEHRNSTWDWEEEKSLVVRENDEAEKRKGVGCSV